MATLTAVRQHPGNRISLPRITRPAVSAGTTVFLAYIFAGLTIQVCVLTQLGISGPEASNWFFITWMTTGLFSLILSLFTKQPVSINLSIAAIKRRCLSEVWRGKDVRQLRGEARLV